MSQDEIIYFVMFGWLVFSVLRLGVYRALVTRRGLGLLEVLGLGVGGVGPFPTGALSESVGPSLCESLPPVPPWAQLPGHRGCHKTLSPGEFSGRVRRVPWLNIGVRL